MKPGMLAALLVPKGKGKGGEDEEPESEKMDEGEGEGDDRAEELAGEVVDALMAKDKEAAVDALLSLIYHCQD